MADLPKLKAEATQNKWQLLFMLAGQGYNTLISEFAEQLNVGMDAPSAQPRPPAGNGAAPPEPPEHRPPSGEQ